MEEAVNVKRDKYKQTQEERELFEQAVAILNPETEEEAMKGIPDECKGSAFFEARMIGALAAQRHIIMPVEKKGNNTGVWKCPICGTIFYDKCNYCKTCGQALDFNGHSQQIILPNKEITRI